MRLRILSPIKQRLGLFLKHIYLIIKYANLVLEITLVELIDVDNIVISVLADGAPETDAGAAIFAKTFHVFGAVVVASEDVRGWLFGGACVGDAGAWYTS